MRATVAAAVVMGFALAAAGCDGSAGRAAGCPDGGCARETTLIFDPPRRFPLDIVLVIDDAALVNRSEQVRASLRALGPYLRSRFDVQVAIVSARPADATSTPLALWPAPSAACGLHAGEPFLRDSSRCGDTPNFDGAPEDQLACAIPDVSSPAASDPGRPIQALTRVLTAARTPALAGLIREWASLSIGIVTAGDDPDAVGPIADVLHAGLLRLKADAVTRVTFQALVALPDGQPCSEPGAGDRAPNLTAFARRFDNGGLDTSCDRFWAERIQMVAPPLLAPLITRCLPGPLVDRDLSSAGTQPECVLQEQPVDPAARAAQSRVIPACTGAAGEPGCWYSVPDAICDSGLRLEVTRHCQAPDGSLWRLSCATSG